MAWTSPRTWTTGELVTASQLNTHVRDNLSYIKGGATIDGTTTISASLATWAFVLQNTNAAQWTGLTLEDSSGSVRVWARWHNASFVGNNNFGVAGASTAEIAANGGPLYLGTFTSDALNFAVAGARKWQINTSGHLLTDTDNAVDIGASGATRPRSIYVGTALAIGTNPAAGGLVRLPNNAVLTWRNAANSGDVSAISVNTNNDIAFNPGGSAVIPGADNTWTLGGSGARWSAVWAANGTIQTSSRDAKNLLGRVDPASALEAVRATPIHRFTYKGNENHPELRRLVHVGFVAEEADSLLCPDAATASPQSTASVALAAIQALDAELRALRTLVEARP